MVEKPGVLEQLGPQARLQAELSKLESRNRDLWMVVAFAAGVLILGALSLLTPSSFWQHNELELKIPPQVLFVVMLLITLVALYMVRRETEVRRLRLSSMQQMFSAQAEFTASMVDSLTNVFSRTFLRELLQGEIARSERSGRSLGLMMCDIDNFKAVNDRYGHLMGDYVLAQIAAILKICVRGSDYVVRYGGDEFLVILSETDETGAQIVLTRIRQKVEDWDRLNRLGEFSVSVSLGLHQHVPGQSPEQTVAEADARMYEDKQRRHGKNAVAPPAPSSSA